MELIRPRVAHVVTLACDRSPQTRRRVVLRADFGNRHAFVLRIVESRIMKIRTVQAILVHRRDFVDVKLLLTRCRRLDHVLKALVRHTLPVHLLCFAALTLGQLAAPLPGAVVRVDGLPILPHHLLIIHHLLVLIQLRVIASLRHLLVHAQAFLVFSTALFASNVAALTYQTRTVLLLLLLEDALGEDVTGLALIVGILLVAVALNASVSFDTVVDVGAAGRAHHIVRARLVLRVHLLILVLQHPLRHGVRRRIPRELSSPLLGVADVIGAVLPRVSVVPALPAVPHGGGGLVEARRLTTALLPVP